MSISPSLVTCTKLLASVQVGYIHLGPHPALTLNGLHKDVTQYLVLINQLPIPFLYYNYILTLY